MRRGIPRGFRTRPSAKTSGDRINLLCNCDALCFPMRLQISLKTAASPANFLLMCRVGGRVTRAPAVEVSLECPVTKYPEPSLLCLIRRRSIDHFTSRKITSRRSAQRFTVCFCKRSESGDGIHRSRSLSTDDPLRERTTREDDQPENREFPFCLPQS